MSEILADARISDIFYIMGLTMVTCLIGFMGILGFMGTITLSNRPWYSSLFTHFPLPHREGRGGSLLLSQENIHYCIGICHRDVVITIHVGFLFIEVLDA